MIDEMTRFFAEMKFKLFIHIYTQKINSTHQSFYDAQWKAFSREIFCFRNET